MPINRDRALKPYFSCINFATALGCAMLVSNANNAHAKAGNDDTVILYIPFLSSSNPTLQTKLNDAFRKQGVTEVVVQNADFWHPYQQGLRQGRIGIYFAQPHFAAWAINKHNFIPLYKLHGTLKYVLASRRAKTSVFEVSDLNGKVVCREPGLNLGTAWLNRLLGRRQLNALTNEYPSIQQEMQNADSSCSAFVIDDFSYEQLNQKLSNEFIRLKQSVIFKHYAFVAHPEVDTKVIVKVKKALKSSAVSSLLNPYLAKLSKWQNLLPVQPNDYSQQDFMLLNTYWGNDSDLR